MDGGKQYVGHLFSVPVYVGFEALFLLFFSYRQYQTATYGWMIPLGILAIILVIVLHELGHALVARACRMPGVAITISAMGGYCSYEGSPPPGRKIMITAAGPLTNFLCGGICWAVLQANLIGEAHLFFFLYSFMFWSFVLGCLNSFPLYPLDGGQITLSICTKYCQRLATAKYVTLVISVIAATAMLAIDYLFISQTLGWNTILIGYLLFAAFMSLR